MTISKCSRLERKAAHRASLRGSLPDDATLRAGLSTALRESGHSGGMAVLHREPNVFASSFPSEIVTCRCESGEELRVLVKQEAGRTHGGNGHRGDVAYETEVYRHVVRTLPCTAPRWLGSYVHPVSADRWLVIEYLDDATRLANALDWQPAIREAARWSARLHAATEGPIAGDARAFLIRYDARYYRHWGNQALSLARALRGRLPWLAPLCRRYLRSLELLLDAPTVIHGEYTPKNVLVRDGCIYPVDWESAAVAAGEIDLASLTDGSWPAPLVEECTGAYQRERWPDGAPSDFPARLEAARLYWSLRWLGDRPDWTTRKILSRRVESLRQLAERAALL